MSEMRMGRRDFLKGMLTISIAATVLPHLPNVPVVEAAVETPKLFIAPNPASIFGRLGRVRINSTWFPLEDAAFTMFRRHAPLIYMPNQYPPTSFMTAAQMGESNLVNSPWKVDIWTPDEDVTEFFADMNEMEFEFDARRASFVGRGFVTNMGSGTARQGEDDSMLFSLTLEGSEKLQRFGNLAESDLL